MAALKNARHEIFAQGVAKGLSATDAYEKAGYKPHQPSASRLLSNAMVSRRIDEIKAKAAERAVVTVEDIARQLDEDRQFARQCGSAAAAVSATMGKAKVLGLVVEKQDHTSSDGSMTPKPTTIDASKMSTDALRELMEALNEASPVHKG